MFDFSSEKSNVKVNFSLADQALPRLKVSLKPFQRLVGAAATGGRSRRSEILLTAFLFVSFFFALATSKKKRNTIWMNDMATGEETL